MLRYMIEHMADVRERNFVRNMFSPNEAYAPLKCFIYLYTGPYTYKTVNAQIRKNVHKITKVIAVVQKQLEQYNK